MSKKKDNIVEVQANKKDSVGLFSGRYRKQEFADKKAKLAKLAKKQKQKGYQEQI